MANGWEDATPGSSGNSPPPTVPFVSVAVRVKPEADFDGAGDVASGDPSAIAVWVKESPVFDDETGRAAGGAEATVRGQRPARRGLVCCHRGYMLEEHEFSSAFGPEDDNRQLFRDLQGPALTASVFSGVNETLFAYGQTGSGKTHTIFGGDAEYGLLQFFVRSIFDHAELSPGSTVHVCCYEVLGDTLTDLVDPSFWLAEGELREEDIVFDELFLKTHKCRYSIVRVGSMDACLGLLRDACVNRSAGVSSLNHTSSRSHAIVHLFVQNPSVGFTSGAATESDGATHIGALTLVDLAGAEKEHENPSEQGRKSTRLINTSLSSLNRLLRKLQTGSLDESERRQSVLNKCLWEYLRPGCGIALVFCVSPLLRHRAVTLSTLAMATDSKLIRNRRKSQAILLPQHREPPSPPPCAQPQRRASMPGACVISGDTPGPHARRATVSAMSYATPSPRTSGRAASTTGRTTPRTPCTPDYCPTPRHTPRTRSASSTAASCLSRGVGDFGCAYGATSANARTGEAAYQQRYGGYDAPHTPSAGSRDLAFQDARRLRRRLGRAEHARARSRDRVACLERERDGLSAENVALQRECDSLRDLFISQQRQQIAFWTGPFPEVFSAPMAADALSTRLRPPSSQAGPAASFGGNANAAAPVPVCAEEMAPTSASVLRLADDAPPVARPFAGRSAALCAAALEADPNEASHPPPATPRQVAQPAPRAPQEARRDSNEDSDLRALQQERDYWRGVAADLKRAMHGGGGGRQGPPRGGRNSQGSSDFSTTHSLADGSEDFSSRGGCAIASDACEAEACASSGGCSGDTYGGLP